MIGAPKLRLRGRPKGIIVWSGGGETVPPGPPTDITWAGSHAVLETATIGTFVGSFVTVIGGVGTVTLTMQDSAGGRFAISGGNRVIVSGALDYDIATSHNITIRASDSALNTYDEVFVVTVTNVVVPISDITWAGSHAVPEDAAIGTTVGGLLSATGGEGAVTFTLVDSAGGTFAISGNNIITNAALNYEVVSSYNITVRATDTVPSTYDEVFTVTVTDVSESVPITDLNWSGTHSVAEDASIGTVVGGVLTTVGGVAPFTYTLTDDAGGLFDVDGDEIIVAGALDFETAEVHSITIRTTDSNLDTYEDNFSISVTDVSGDVPVAYISQSAYVAYAIRTNTVIAAPAGIAAGDFLLAFIATGGSTLQDAPSPATGWAEIPVGNSFTGVAGFFVRYCVYYKVAGASEPSSYTFTHDSSSTCGVAIAYSGVDTASPFSPASTKNTGTGLTATALGVTTTVADTFIVFTEQDWGADTINTTPPSLMPDERVDAVILYISDGTVAAIGATGDVSHTCNNNTTDKWNAFLIPLKRA